MSTSPFAYPSVYLSVYSYPVIYLCLPIIYSFVCHLFTCLIYLSTYLNLKANTAVINTHTRVHPLSLSFSLSRKESQPDPGRRRRGRRVWQRMRRPTGEQASERARGRRRAAPWSPSPGALPGRDSPPRTLIIGLTSVGIIGIMQMIVTGFLFDLLSVRVPPQMVRIIEAPGARREPKGDVLGDSLLFPSSPLSASLFSFRFLLLMISSLLHLFFLTIIVIII